MIRILLLLLVFMTGCGIAQPESGVHRGVITDVSKAGFLCKTWEGELISGTGAASIHYRFTVDNDEAAHVLQEAQRTGAEVLIKYEVPFLRTICSSDHANIVTSAEIVQPKK